MRKSIIFVIGVLAFLTGCGPSADKASNVPTKPKWQGAPYHIAFDAKTPKPNPAGIAIPDVQYTANPEMVEMRAALVVRIDPSDNTKSMPAGSQMVMVPVNVPGTEGALPADYMDATDKNLSAFLQSYCIKGKVKVSVLLARSSVAPQPTDAELESKRLSDWLPIELPFKNPHPNCTPHAAPQAGPLQ